MNDRDLLGPYDPTAAYGAVDAGSPRPPMVDFRGHDGRCLAVPYARLLSLAMDPDVGIELTFPGHGIIIRGRNLDALYQLLVEHRVTFVQEGDLDVLSESDTFVDSIVVAPPAVVLEADS